MAKQKVLFVIKLNYCASNLTLKYGNKPFYSTSLNRSSIVTSRRTTSLYLLRFSPYVVTIVV